MGKIRKRKVFRGLLLVFGTIAAIGFVGAASAALIAVSFLRNLPSPEEIRSREVSQSTKIYDRTGEILLYEIHGEEKRTIIPGKEIPDSIRHATIAIEDQNFYTHPAFDWRANIRAGTRDLLHLEIAEGASTITQQLAKNAFLSREQTLTRKVREILLALRLEEQYSKDEILDLYLNQIPYGANAYGIEAAAKAYFGKSAKDLPLAEVALLAAVAQAPTYYSPWGSHLDELLKRKDRVLAEMAKLGFITEEEKNSASAIKLKFQPQGASIKAPHFVAAVQDYLVKKYGEETLERGGLKIVTTLDWKLQEIAERVVLEGAKRNTELYKGKNAALFAQDPKTGQVLAVVGSRDYFDVENEGNFNVAMQGLRQPGSSFKPFAYITAFKKGYTPETVLFDVETEFDASGIPGRSYKPGNFDENFRGPINLRNALAQSINIPAVKVMYLAGIDNVLKTASDFGITTLTERNRYGLSLVLGGGEVKLSEIVGAYGVFATEGMRHEQAIILEITDSNGAVLEKFSDKETPVIEPQYARLISDILSDTEARAPLYGASLNLTVFEGRDVALKTGTTNNYVDAWAIGYTPSLAAGVWAGNNHREPLQKKGGSILAAVPIWSAFMKEALKDTPEELFSKPDPYTSAKPVLKGNYIAGNQVHSILYYVDKDDPQGPYPENPEGDSQFSNWEEPVLSWARMVIPNFDQDFNKPGGSVEEVSSGAAEIALGSPQNGSFVQTSFPLRFDISSEEELAAVEIYWNANLLERSLIGNKNFHYEKGITPGTIETQNVLHIKVFGNDGVKAEETVILYR